MGSGKLLISLANGVLGIGGKDNEHYVVGETTDALNGAILATWENPDRAFHIAANGRNYVQSNFDAEIITKEYREELRHGRKG
jgi:glycosyltransferase involved in cell wall biosynthesis